MQNKTFEVCNMQKSLTIFSKESQEMIHKRFRALLSTVIGYFVT